MPEEINISIGEYQNFICFDGVNCGTYAVKLFKTIIDGELAKGRYISKIEVKGKRGAMALFTSSPIKK